MNLTARIYGMNIRKVLKENIPESSAVKNQRYQPKTLHHSSFIAKLTFGLKERVISMNTNNE